MVRRRQPNTDPHSKEIVQATEEILSLHDHFYDQWHAMSKPQQYKYRKALYAPGDVLSVPTHPAFGGDGKTAGLVVVASCNWLGLIEFFLVDEWIASGAASAAITPSDVVEAWWGGDDMLLGGVFEQVGRISDYDFESWPIAVGPSPILGDESSWTMHLSTRKKRPVRRPFEQTTERRPVNLFLANTAHAVIVRSSERQFGRPLDPWPIQGHAPGVIQQFRIPQTW